MDEPTPTHQPAPESAKISASSAPLVPTLASIMGRNPAIWAERGSPCAIVDPETGAPTGLIITSKCRDSAAYLAATDTMVRERTEAILRTPSLRTKPVQAAEQAQVEARLLAAVFMHSNLVDFPTGEAAVTEFYLSQPWVREQVEQHVTDRKLFMKPL